MNETDRGRLSFKIFYGLELIASLGNHIWIVSQITEISENNWIAERNVTLATRWEVDLDTSQANQQKVQVTCSKFPLYSQPQVRHKVLHEARHERDVIVLSP